MNDAIFSERVRKFFKGKFFKDKGVVPNKIIDRGLIDHLFKQFNDQSRLHVTSSFIVSATADYLNIHPHQMRGMLCKERSRRGTPFFYAQESHTFNLKTKPNLINLLGKSHRPSYKLTTPNGSMLTPNKRARVQAATQEHDVSYTPLQSMKNSERARAHAIVNGSKYERDLIVNDEIALWRKNTPARPGDEPSPNRVKRTTLPPCRLPFYASENAPEYFEFSVTAEDIYARMGVKRPVSQTQVMAGKSAKDILIALGAIISQNQDGRDFHWAHRHGWSLNGAQAKDNLDPTTAGSNYDTLFKVEAPIKSLLLEQGVDCVLVKGEVQFFDDVRLPKKITYVLSWGNGHSMEVIIDPMNSRIPTVDEHEVAMQLFRL